VTVPHFVSTLDRKPYQTVIVRAGEQTTCKEVESQQDRKSSYSVGKLDAELLTEGLLV